MALCRKLMCSSSGPAVTLRGILQVLRLAASAARAAVNCAPRKHPALAICATLAVLLCMTALTAPAFSSCAAPQNPIEAENCLPGDTSWEVGQAGDSSIVGFTTDMSVNLGQTISFKINTSATAYTIDIWRMGYYGGAGARLVTSLKPPATLPQNQPPCLTDTSTGLVDCGNWAVSTSWTVPTSAVSGIYFAVIRRQDTGRASHIFFVVRDDNRASDLVFQTSDLAWQAYNTWGPQGQSLYGCSGTYNASCRAYKVSYNRPFITRTFNSSDWLMNAEYPMVRWLEANGYDVSYISGVDSARYGSLLKSHKVFLSVGHDEYWSGEQRANVEAARAAGVNLAFFSGNEVFWKTRFENSIDGSNTPYRTLVCYKETHANAVIDPADPSTWTGTWRDPRFSPPADGGRPENALTGTIFRVNSDRSDSIVVSQAEGRLRFWRNTAMAILSPNQSISTPAGTLGYEWDTDEDNGWRPAGLFDLSTSTVNLASQYLLDYGNNFGSGTATHHLTLYRHSSGALVFGSGTVQWPWGLDNHHDLGNGVPTDANMQQATVNLLADMGAQPASLQPGLVSATRSADTIAPSSAITSPAAAGRVIAGSAVTITGTAADSGGGVVAGVEVSVDGGTTWHPASGRESWSYSWQVQATGTLTIRSRAVDDNGNLEVPSAGVQVTANMRPCPCTIWSSAATPGTVDDGSTSPIELGVKFQADTGGYITGLRFYKSSANTGTHIGNLWGSSGSQLATATYTGETASGWQQVSFTPAVAISANTVYVASYHTYAGHLSVDNNYFSSKGTDNPPLHALASGVSGPNGVYAYGGAITFPTNSYLDSNYWVDVVFTPFPPVSITVTPSNPAIVPGATQQFTATATYQDNSTADATGQATWASSATNVGTIDINGLATGVAVGTSTISASLNGTTGSTKLAVNNPVPSLLSMSPASAAAGSSGFTLTVTGNSFVASSAVQVKGSPRTTTFVSSTQLTASIPASDVADGAYLPITVVNPAPGGGTSGALTFTVNNPVPAISKLSPNPVVATSSSFTLTVTGSGFVPGSVVQYDGSPIATAFVSCTQLNALVPARGIAATGNHTVTVFNRAPAGGTSNAATLTVVALLGW
jgi:N,N-dimethylformamidase beta subunit-like protein/uncharacterized protein DUF4082/Big-like domain-containing protein